MMRASRILTGFALGSLLLGGCDAFKTKYSQSTLEDAVRRVTPSPTDRYRIPRPSVVAVKGNTGIIREGSLFVIIVGPNLKRVLQEYPDDVEFGVRLANEPRRHLIVEKVYQGNTETDLLDGQGRFKYHFPNFVDPQDVPFTEFASSADLEQTGEKVAVHQFSVEKKACPNRITDALVAMGQKVEPDKPRYFLISQQYDYVVENRDPMTRLVLDYFIAEKRSFEGGLRIEHVFDAPEKRATNCGGCVTIQWIKLSGSLYFLV